MNLDEAVGHLDKVEVFQNLRPGTFVWVQLSTTARNPFVIEQVRDALVDVMGETGCRMLMTPSNMVEGMKVLSLEELVQLNDMFTRAIEQRMGGASADG